MSGKKTKVDPASPFAKLKGMKEALAASEAQAKAAPKSEGAARRPAASAGAGAGPATLGTSRARPANAKSTDAEDAVAFHRLVSGVTPLGEGSRRIPRSQEAADVASAAEQAKKREAARVAVQEEAQSVHDHLRQLVEGGARFEVSDDGHRVEGRRVEIPHDVVRKLRRGVMPIDARIDLHGQRAGDARDALEAFLREKRTRGERCVLVVHGKGEHSPAGQGILRGEIAAWLSQSRASDHVAAFSTAAEGDGGEGAVYVLLRR